MKNKKILILVSLLLFLFLLVGCKPFPPQNQAPIITSAPGETATVGLQYTYTITATDHEEDDITYSLVSGPDGMLFDGIATIVWEPTEGQVGDHGVTVEANDGKDGTILDFKVTVSEGVTESSLWKIEVEPTEFWGRAGDTLQLEVTAYYDDGTSANVTLECNYIYKPEALSQIVVTVSDEGLITGIQGGNTVISVSYTQRRFLTSNITRTAEVSIHVW